MFLKEFRSINFRNYSDLSIELPKEGALFVGKNGSGKTNLLESIGFLLLGKSIRFASMKQMLQKGAESAFVEALFYNSISYQQSVGFSKDGSVIVRQNGLETNKLSTLYGKNRYIYFGPRDISLVTGSPDDKRTFVDIILSQVDSEYLQNLILYRKYVSDRNRVLTTTNDQVLLDIYDETVSKSAIMIMSLRNSYFKKISSLFSSLYSEIGRGDLELSVHYQQSAKVMTVDEYHSLLKERRVKDYKAGFTTIGPHRDNYTFRHTEGNLVGYGSQGQCRSAALALKGATIDFLQGEEVIIAVDDAFSDLDDERKKLFFEKIRTKGQLLMTLHSEKDAKCFDMKQLIIKDSRVYEL